MTSRFKVRTNGSAARDFCRPITALFTLWPIQKPANPRSVKVELERVGIYLQEIGLENDLK